MSSYPMMIDDVNVELIVIIIRKIVIGIIELNCNHNDNDSDRNIGGNSSSNNNSIFILKTFLKA